jgi:hypothetical protein
MHRALSQNRWSHPHLASTPANRRPRLRPFCVTGVAGVAVRLSISPICGVAFADPHVGAQASRDAHCLAKARDFGLVLLRSLRTEWRLRPPKGRRRLHDETELLGRRFEPRVVITTAPRRVLNTSRGVQPVSGLVEKHLEHLNRREVQRLTGEEYLTSHLAIGNPSPAPPMAHLDQSPALHPAAENYDDVWHTRV